MDSHLKCIILLRRMRKSAAFVGGDMTVKNWRPNFNTIAVMGLVHLTVFFCGYTQIKVFLSGRYLLTFSICAYFGILLQGISKFHYLRMNQAAIYEITQDLLSLHSKNQDHEGRKQALNKCIDRCLYGFTIFSFMYASVGAGFFSYPLLAYLFYKQEHVLFVEIYLPFVDHHDKYGYIVTLCYQVVIITAAVTGTLMADSIFFVISAHYTALVDIFSISVEELTTKLKYDGDAKYKAKIEAELHELFEHHQRLIKFLQTHNGTFTELCFYEIFATILMILTSLFVGKLKFWVPGYILGVGSLYQLLCYCCFGTIIELSNDQIYGSIFELPWYYMSRSCCKDYMFMVASAQNPSLIMLGGVAPLSVATAQEVLKSLYSYFMLLCQFTEGKEFDW